MMTMMTMILTTWMDRDRIQHPEGLMTVTMQIQAIPRKVAKARTVARRILDADNTNSIEQLVAAASPATSNSAPPLGEHLFSALSKCLITPPSLPLFFRLPSTRPVWPVRPSEALVRKSYRAAALR
jgi:hypothetical protein